MAELERLDASMFDRLHFREILHSLTIGIHITEAEVDPLHPTRPKLHFAGDDPATILFSGWVGYTPDDHIQWYFVSPVSFITTPVALNTLQEYGENGEMTWR
jgi:hypothetical protein